MNERNKNIMRKLLYAILAISMLMLCSCAEKSDIPDVYCQDGVIYLNDKVLDESDTLVIKRIDNSIISIWTGEKYINVTPDGTELTLSDLIVDKEAYEEGIKEIVDWQLSVRNSVGPTKEQYEEIMNVLSSYDETVKLDFCVNDLSITIFAPYVSVRLDYDYAFIAEKYKPVDGLMCTSHLTGRCISYFPDDIDRDEYNSLWVRDSIEIQNYNGANYYMYKTCYQKELGYGGVQEDDIYYLVISKDFGDNDIRVIGYKLIDENYNCSFRDFEETLKTIK